MEPIIFGADTVASLPGFLTQLAERSIPLLQVTMTQGQLEDPDNWDLFSVGGKPLLCDAGWEQLLYCSEVDLEQTHPELKVTVKKAADGGRCILVVPRLESVALTRALDRRGSGYQMELADSSPAVTVQPEPVLPEDFSLDVDAITAELELVRSGSAAFAEFELPAAALEHDGTRRCFVTGQGDPVLTEAGWLQLGGYGRCLPQHCHADFSVAVTGRDGAKVVRFSAATVAN